MGVYGVYGYLWVSGCLWVSMNVCMCDYEHLSVDGSPGVKGIYGCVSYL